MKDAGTGNNNASKPKPLQITLVEWRPDNNLFKDSLGIQYIASALRKEKHEVEIIVYESETLDTAIKEIAATDPDVLGVQFYSTNPEESYTIAQKVKHIKPDTVVVFGGHAATLHGMKIMYQNDFIDYVIYGEGEVTFCDLCERIKNHLDFSDCEGIFYRDAAGIHKTTRRNNIEVLDTLPFPALDLQKKDIKGRVSVLANIQTARGCLGNCAFCVETRIINRKYDKRWRGRTAENVVEEIEYIKSNFPDKRLGFSIIDSSFEDPDPKGKARLYRFAELLKEKNIQCAFSFFTRADSWSENDSELIALLRSVGLYKVQVGFESGSDNILDIFNKKADVEDNRRVAQLFSEHGVKAAGFSIMFHPYVKFEDLRANAEFLKQIGIGHLPEMWFHKVDLHSDSRMFSQIASDGLLLGVMPGGYYFSYTYTDGRIEQLSRIIELFSRMQGPFEFNKETVKIDHEQLLYGVWKNYYPELLEVETEMQEYRNLTGAIYQQVVDKQYDLFTLLVDASENGDLNKIAEKTINEWNDYLNKKTNELKSIWMKNRVRCARKNVQLI